MLIPIIFKGSDLPDRRFGGDADDVIELYGGDDFADGGAGRDSLDGNAGADTLLGGEGDDRLDGAAGDDCLDGGDGADTLIAGLGSDRLFGGDGVDVAVFVGPRSLYDIVLLGEVTTVTARAGGAATRLVGVEVLRFAEEAPLSVIVARADAATLGEDDAAVTLDVIANDSGGVGPLQVIWVMQPSAGRTSASGSLVWFETAGAFDGLKAGETAAVEVQYGAGDGINGAYGSAVVTVVGANDAPLATVDTAVIGEDDPLAAIDVVANDRDPDGDPLQVIWVMQPSAGRTSGGGSHVFFETLGAFNGLKAGETATVEFQHGVGDGITGAYSSTRVTVVGVNDAPLATVDSAVVGEDDALTVIDVVANDSDPDGDPIQVIWVMQPSAGRTSGGGAHVFFETLGAFDGLKAGETATLEFQHGVGDGITGAYSSTRVTVVGVNDAPLATVDHVTIGEDDPCAVIDVVANDSDPDGDPLQVIWVMQPSAGRTSGGGSHVLFETLGAFDGLKAGETATVEVRHGVGDGITGAYSSIIVTVVGANDAPVPHGAEGGDDPLPFESLTVVEDEPPLEIDVLDGFRDPDGDTLFVSVAKPPAKGVARIEGDSIIFDQQGAFDHLKAGETETVVIGYVVSDGALGVAGDVTVTIVGANDDPTARADRGLGFSTSARAAFSTASVLSNDTDPDGDSLVVAEFDLSETVGAVTHLGGGVFRYDPAGGFDHLLPGETAIDRFSYAVSDGAGGASRATVEIEVVGAAPATQQVVVYVTGQSYLGDPAFDLLVNGVTVAADVVVPSPAERLHREDRVYAAYSFDIDARIDIETVAVVYREDAWSGEGGAADRNLFVSGVEFGGKTYASGDRSLFTPSAGPDPDKEFLVGLTGDIQWPGALEFSREDDEDPSDPGDTGDGPVRFITVYAAGEGYLGDPQFRLSVNGRFVGDAVGVPSGPGPLSDAAAEATAQPFDFAIRADLPLETIGVTFVNDRYFGARDADRNLYLSRIVIDEVELRPADGAVSIGPEHAAIREAAEQRGVMYTTGTLLFDVSDLFSG